MVVGVWGAVWRPVGPSDDVVERVGQCRQVGVCGAERAARLDRQLAPQSGGLERLQGVAGVDAVVVCLLHVNESGGGEREVVHGWWCVGLPHCAPQRHAVGNGMCVLVWPNPLRRNGSRLRVPIKKWHY